MLALTSVILVLSSVYLIYTYIIYPIYISPLRHVPSAHPTAPFSPLWILYKRYTSQQNKAIHDAHLKHGPFIRLGPNEVAVNTISHGVKTIYSGNFEKHRWYDQMVNFGNVPNMFSTLANKPHAARKRMMSNVYSKTYLQHSRGMEDISRSLVFGRLLPKLDRMLRSGASDDKGATKVDIMAVMNATTMDFVTAWLFGLKNSSKLLLDDEKLRWWMDVFLRRIPYGFFGAEMPSLEGWLAWLGIKMAPDHVAVANKEIGEWVMEMCDKADADLAKIDDHEVEPADMPVVWAQLRAKSAKERQDIPFQTGFDDKMLAASDMWDHLTAGFETSGITLTYVFYELTRNMRIQSALRDELHTLAPSIVFRSDSTTASQGLPSPKSIDALPLLNAVLMETLRLHSAIPGPQPRLSPAQGCVLGGPSLEVGGYYIPSGTRLSSQAYSLHRDPDVFEDPEVWLPSRWLAEPEDALIPGPAAEQRAARQEEKLKLMHRAFWAFSNGSRMCIGNNFATQEMKLVIAAVISNFELLEVGDGKADEAMVQEDAYTAQPLGRELRVRMRPWKN